MRNKNALRNDLAAITDLCQAINAVEGADCSPEYQKQTKRICKTLYKQMLTHAEYAILDGATDKQLRKALTAAGWEDQTFCMGENDIIKIIHD